MYDSIIDKHSETLSRLSPEKRHFCIGVNCYQYALGIMEPIIVRDSDQTDCNIFYVKLQPGKDFIDSVSNEIENLITKQRVDEYQELLDGCAKDELIDCGNEMTLRDGYHTISLFQRNNSRFDFHFARYFPNEDVWRSKTPWKLPETVSSINEAKVAYGATGYKFDRFMLAPMDSKPVMLEGLGLNPVTVGHGANQTTLFETICPGITLELLDIFPLAFTYSRSGSVFKHIHQHETESGPAPAWPPRLKNGKTHKTSSMNQRIGKLLDAGRRLDEMRAGLERNEDTYDSFIETVLEEAVPSQSSPSTSPTHRRSPIIVISIDC